MTQQKLCRGPVAQTGLAAFVLAVGALVAGCAGSSIEPAVATSQTETATVSAPARVPVPAVTGAIASAATLQIPSPSGRTRGAVPEPQRPLNGAASTSATTQPVYKIGAPYTIGGRTYVPAEDPDYDEVGQASWYGEGFHGKPTANGEIFDMQALVAAHPTLPMPSYVLVTNQRNGRTIMLRVNNRGPYSPGRIIDVSHEAARMLGFADKGVTDVRVKYAGPATLAPGDAKERAYLTSQPWYRSAIEPRSAAVAPPLR